MRAVLRRVERVNEAGFLAVVGFGAEMLGDEVATDYRRVLDILRVEIKPTPSSPCCTFICDRVRRLGPVSCSCASSFADCDLGLRR
jgi:hypothetical protein